MYILELHVTFLKIVAHKTGEKLGNFAEKAAIKDDVIFRQTPPSPIIVICERPLIIHESALRTIPFRSLSRMGSENDLAYH